MEERLIGPHEVAGKLRHDYLSSIDYPDCRLLDALERVLSKLHGKSFRVRDFLQDTAQLIYMQLNINSLSIGLKDLDGDKFRYHAFAGLRP
ncbi:MAG: hypothetical protein OEV21_07875, partial [Thermoplasmata archaeon]|nr:hypothetical protein [Thermoplasmata archaeon]